MKVIYLKICKIKESYIEFLRNLDDKVLYNKNQTRPYIGILFNIGDVKYFAPLASPKNKHLNMKDKIDFIKIDNGKLGAINLNNMIPVISLVVLDFNIENVNNSLYRNLLYNQLEYINKNNKNIVKKATLLYKRVCNFNGKINARCVNFNLLENSINMYKEN